MSNFNRPTINPKTGEIENADWMDSFYGKHHYGVVFPDGATYQQDAVKLPTDEELAAWNKAGETSMSDKVSEILEEIDLALKSADTVPLRLLDKLKTLLSTHAVIEKETAESVVCVLDIEGEDFEKDILQAELTRLSTTQGNK